MREVAARDSQVKPIRRDTQQSPAGDRKGGSGYGMDDFYVTIPYGLVVLGGGIAGYVKRGSAASLAAGAGFGGALLLAGALSIWAFARHSSSLFATVLQTGPLLLLLIPLTHPLFIFVVLVRGVADTR
jgi:hypothetical protein